MCKGIVFDIKEFSINDGPGVRTTVFMKGCPLNCVWCHNPEGISLNPQINYRTNETKGVAWEIDDLVQRVKKNKDVFELSGGGVTFSGGEPTLQYNFLMQCLDRLKEINCLLDTSGFCEEKRFMQLARSADEVYFDLKLANEEEHLKYTGVSNAIILNNLENICKEGMNVTVRLPMIPQITDTESNLSGIAGIIRRFCSKDVLIHVLPYNKYAEGKYDAYGLKYGLRNWYRVNNYENVVSFVSSMRTEGYQVINYLEKETD